jgi:predicted metal-dependent phosphotriesterase family hydrolase
VSITTVRGEIDAADLGFCLPHEHVLINLWRTAAARWDIDGILSNETRQAREIGYFREAGGVSIVDLSLPHIGRDPAGLRRIAEESDVQIVMGCGWYRQPYYPPEIDLASTQQLTAELVAEITRGVGDTGIRPGIIGEIGSHKHYATAQEERVFRAVARAQLETGLSITTHSVASEVGLQHLGILIEEGVSPDRIVIGHCDSHLELAYLSQILAAGAYVQFDNIGYPLPLVASLEEDLVAMILTLRDQGHVERILLSQDVCRKAHLKAFGGPGYDYLPTTFHSVLSAAGITDAEWTTMTVTNPARVLNT